jgi:hypothetical protein
MTSLQGYVCGVGSLDIERFECLEADKDEHGRDSDVPVTVTTSVFFSAVMPYSACQVFHGTELIQPQARPHYSELSSVPLSLRHPHQHTLRGMLKS